MQVNSIEAQLKLGRCEAGIGHLEEKVLGGNNFERPSDLRNLLFYRLDCTADLVGSKFGR
jgi:hypothetical protein